MSPKFEEVKRKNQIIANQKTLNFNRLKQTADDKTLTMPPTAQVCSHEFDFKHFINHVFMKFIDAFMKEMIDAFSQLKFCCLTFLTLENFRSV